MRLSERGLLLIIIIALLAAIIIVLAIDRFAPPKHANQLSAKHAPKDVRIMPSAPVLPPAPVAHPSNQLVPPPPPPVPCWTTTISPSELETK